MFDPLAEAEAAIGDAFHQGIDFPEASEVVVRRFHALDVDELVEFVILPECGGEGGGGDEEIAVEPEHARHIREMPLDALAGGSAFMEGAAEFHHESGFPAEFGGFHGHGGG